MKEKKEKYPVEIPTSAGSAVIKSSQQWEEIRMLGEYLARLRSGKIAGTNKVRMSVLFTNTPEDAKREVRGSNRVLDFPTQRILRA